MAATDKTKNEILLVSITPYFLERDAFWYAQNFEKIKFAAKNQLWWKKNTLFLEEDLEMNLYALMRQISELGYEKVQTLGAPGEFAQRGGLIEIFPINSRQAHRIEFSGKRIERIEELPVTILKKEKEIKKELSQRLPQSLLSNLKPGDFLVHLDHGIGVFAGFAQEPGGPISAEPPTEKTLDRFFVLEYSKGDKLYVPLAKEEKLSRYIGFERPIVHRLGGTLWFKTKRQVKANVIALAKQLLELYAKRSLARGFQYGPDTHWQKELEADFPYVETDDQLRAVAEVKRDMESAKPMDRLVCGDVGFGKTEVALRAAFKAVMAGKQVALLAPTTILANQHFRTFEERLKRFPTKLALLTRLQSKGEQKRALEDIAKNQIDILIGTHRLLSRDVSFANLGLAIIDEEQRFGVRQKERFKEWKKENPPRDVFSPSGEKTFYGVDVLSLSATPIPRTMHLALSGMRDISVINTPPPGRLPVKTFIEPFIPLTIKRALEQELARGGQAYYLHNRVETIGPALRTLQKLLPEARLAFIHGRMKEKELVKIMDEFAKKEIDVLIATTIIENGLDFPNVNTLVVANAVRLGLAQAYQIRGRIGRSHQQAFAYFFYSAKNLTDEARARLEALEQAQAPGSGYQIALRDLEIRGAGNILGKEQSGPINAVGLNLYMQMLSETIEELKANI